MLSPILCGATVGLRAQAPALTPGSSQPPSEGFQMLIRPQSEAQLFRPVVRERLPLPLRLPEVP